MTAEVVTLAGALFLSFLIVTSVARQRTPNRLQKGLLVLSILFLSASLVTNLVLATQPGSDLVRQVDTTKRIQGTLDIAFALGIGAFVLVTTTPELDTLRKLGGYLRARFPDAYVYYAALLGTTLVALHVTPVSVMPLGGDRYSVALPLWFLVLVILTVVAILAYPAWKLLRHVRRSGTRLTTARDAYLVLVGMSGFVLTEVGFEILLPALVPDLRPVGFLIQMGFVGLLALPIRRPEFLQVLSEAGRRAVPVPSPSPLPQGHGYLVDHRDQGLPLFAELVRGGHDGLCITRAPPDRVAGEHDLSGTPVLWLSRVAAHRHALRPVPVENVFLAAAHFLEATPGGVLLLDGLEYLIAHNGFSNVLKLVQDLVEMTAHRNGVLLLPLDPGALKARERALIARETTSLGTGLPPRVRERPPPGAA